MNTASSLLNKYGAVLHINNPFYMHDVDKPIIIDVETDEKDNFVGAAITQDGIGIWYYTDLELFKFKLIGDRFIGHNIKGDLKWLINWGVDVSPDHLYYDTILASYVHDTTKESHGLKALAKEYLGMEWPTYKEMVHPDAQHPTKKVTLDRQSVDRVAAYCGTDCLATYRLWQYFENKALTIQEKRYLQEIELPTARVLLKMELMGTAIDIPYLQGLKKEFEEKLKLLVQAVERYWKGEKALNINSNAQIAELLESQGAKLPTTEKGHKKVDKKTLEGLKALEAVPLLLEYNKYEKLLSTYVLPLLEKSKDGRIHCSFNQITKDHKGDSVGISTSRLSSSSPNLQNIPTRTEEGKMIRKAFIAGEGKVLIDADFSQIEPRVLAHFSQDPFLLQVFREDRDLYSELLGPERRDDSKTGWLAVTYGAQAKKLMGIFNKTEADSQAIIDSIYRKIPGFLAWKIRTLYEARQKGFVETLFKRRIIIENLTNANKYERFRAERLAINYIIQGSAAEIMKKGLVRLDQLGLTPNITIHDEFLVEGLDSSTALIKQELENLVQLSVPLKVSIGTGKTWQEAKV